MVPLPRQLGLGLLTPRALRGLPARLLRAEIRRMTSGNGWPISPPPNHPPDAPLWLRTQRRLHRMATFTAQHQSFELGCDPVIQAMEDSIQSQCRLLVLLLKRWEEHSSQLSSEPLDGVSKLVQSASAAPQAEQRRHEQQLSSPRGEP